MDKAPWPNRKLAKYIVTCGPFDDETDNIKQARKVLAAHAKKMFEKYGRNQSYGLYMLVEQKKAR